MDGEIKITALRCGTMTVKAGEAFIAGRGIIEKRITLPVNAFLIEHPIHGRILVDTGWGADVKTALPKRLLDYYRPEIRPGETAAEQLAAMGISPEDIDLVILTHLDADNTGGLKDFAGKAKRIVCAELEYFYSCRYVYKRREDWDSWFPYADSIERIYYRASVLGPEKRGFDLFGDDSLICIYCPGHTDGSFALIVSRSPSNRFIDHGDGKYGGHFAVITGDLAFSQRNVDEGIEPGQGFNRKQQRAALSFLKELQNDPMHTATLYSHSEAPEVIVL